VNSITSGPDGFLYFTEPQRNSIGRINPNALPASGNVDEHFQVITNPGFSTGAPPTGITTGPDGNIWFTEGSGKSEGGPSPIHKIGRLTLGKKLSLSSSSFNFGSKAVGSTSTPQTFSITSLGADDIAFSGFPISGANAGDFKVSSNGCSGQTLKNSDPASPGPCSLSVTFTPSATGNRAATLTLTFAGGSQTIALAGSGFIPSGSAKVNPTSINFGNQTVGTSSGLSKVTVSSGGPGPLNFATASVTGANSSDFVKSVDTCTGQSFPSGGTCSISVLFRPTAAGARTATLSLNDSGSDSPQIVTLSGQGIPGGPGGPPPSGAAGGYWLAATDGGIFNYGDTTFYGSAGSIRLNKPIVGMAATPSLKGYWLVATDGGIFTYGDAGFFGSTGAIHLNKPIVGMAPTASGKGYWLVASDGGIFTYGDAGFFGSAGSIRLNQPIVGMAATPSGEGYWLVASDGGIFTYGDATFFGSTGAIHLNKPIVGMAPAPTGRGYWLVATDGGIFNYGDSSFFGSAGAIHLNKPIVGMASTPDGGGYWLVATDGGIFNYGDAGFFGSAGGIRLNQPIVGMAGSP
jgi:hypothetical protein